MTANERGSDAPNPDDPLGLHGIVPPTITAFDEDGALDEAATAAHARFVVDRGVHGVFPLGTTGEFPLLTAEERDRVVEVVVEEVGDEVPVLAGVGAEGTREAIERAQAAEEAGADGLVVVDPYYFPIGEDGLVEHVRRIADATESPIYAYTFPDRSGNDLTVDALSRLAEIDGFAGIKDTSRDVGRMQVALDAHPELTYLIGVDRLAYTGLSLGCAGAVVAVANAFPEVAVELYEAVRAGDDERARELQSDLSAVQAAIEQGPFLAGVKAMLDLRGFDVGPLRSPLQSFDDDQREQLRETLVDLYDEERLSVE
ncbi:2-keto-3-deoxy-phosphogluconate aldolase [Natronoarchaeum philippinense]|uniref:2-keto-3-deoxy-phosphogluconate aldolase n=1 Tax=Natronoarchaeum philippinense TaxID=558529 RepID=A0A285NBA0_NATPI|nr:dihydrodipicolinate synthase family protein [Natronoarchaeum philippinense]SNZ04961.1 2-keto-3-deoxy-phosphogluconate aldolase [Natronoarchaeum philippinense]